MDYSHILDIDIVFERKFILLLAVFMSNRSLAGFNNEAFMVNTDSHVEVLLIHHGSRFRGPRLVDLQLCRQGFRPEIGNSTSFLVSPIRL